MSKPSGSHRPSTAKPCRTNAAPLRIPGDRVHRSGRQVRVARLYLACAFSVAAVLSGHVFAAETKPNIPPVDGRPKLLAKEVFLRHDHGRPVASGFICYVSKTQPVLMHCFGRERSSSNRLPLAREP